MFPNRVPLKGDLCYRVYCASQLGNTSFNFASSKQLIKPLFYVNVMDITSLQAEPFYLACERIFLVQTYSGRFLFNFDLSHDRHHREHPPEQRATL